MKNFQFKADAEAYSFCEKIVQTMMTLFSISEDEAVGRVNRHFAGQTIGGDDIVYHEDELFWAKTIYYEADAKWWIQGITPKPRPYP